MKRRLIIIAIALSVSFILMTALSLFSIERLNTYIIYSDLMDHSGFVIEKILSAEKTIRDIDRSERGYMITKDTNYIRYFDHAVDSIYTNISALKEMTTDNPLIQKNISILEDTIAMRIKAGRANIAYVDTCKTSMLSKFYYDSRLYMLGCSRLLKTIHTFESNAKADQYKGEQYFEKLTSSSIKWLLLIFCIITLTLFAFLIKELRGRMSYQEELQGKILDLKRSHEELQEIAFVAAHHLQEPLRKIQVFSNMMLFMNAPDLGSDNRANLERINNLANRMQALIKDLNSLTSLTKVDKAKKDTDLNRMMVYVTTEMDEKIKETGTSLEINVLPKIKGYENQLKILFTALLDNAMKFTRPFVRPFIVVDCKIVSGSMLTEINPKFHNKKFYCISVSDNGIGFEKQFNAKMFQIFQRLHHYESAFDGKGIGLAICQRIMANHEGYISAEGEPDKGATFKLFFPVEE